MGRASVGTNRFMARPNFISTTKADLHIVDGIDGDTGHADIAHDARVVGVIAAVSGQIKGHAEALLAGSQILPVEAVAFLDSAEAGILANGPRLARVHCGIGTAGVRKDTRILGFALVCTRVHWLDGQAL